MLLEQLLRPFGYLAIRHPYKWRIDWLYPVVLALLTVALLACLGNLNDVVKGGGVISLVLGFVQSLPGFYIAALAAIATFGKSDIDSVLPEPTPRIKVRFRDTENLISLTRRRFLAMLFSFLTAESIVLIMISIFSVGYGTSIVSLSIGTIEVGFYVGWLSVFVYFLLLHQMILATFWGLYYLGYKLHE
ncbi:MULTISPECIES: hypothetical protein [Pseudomonadaceae]|uniref:hypothetical protein n=1 Tax=Pseudomonadaceae TaxID=135621 RepID=UPI001153EC25|nr:MULTISPECIES: hypothetical protein [Pseudomonas]MCP1617057.1 hypothetical protein [Pseudomonas otitidis]